MADREEVATELERAQFRIVRRWSPIILISSRHRGMIVCCVLIVIILRKPEESAIAHVIKLLLAVLLANYVVDQK